MQENVSTVFVFIDRNTAFSTVKRDTSFFLSHLSFCHETAMVALDTGRIQIRLEVAGFLRLPVVFLLR